jgi:hypothetical protein
MPVNAPLQALETIYEAKVPAGDGSATKNLRLGGEEKMA